MSKTGAIVILEDDADDIGILEEVLKDLNIHNKLIWFNTSDDALRYLKETNEQPFIIFSDINLPGRTGLDFKQQIDEDEELRQKSIPFIFYSTAADPNTVTGVYMKMAVQGYFQKASGYAEIKNMIKVIVDYWQVCKHPNSL